MFKEGKPLARMWKCIKNDPMVLWEAALVASMFMSLLGLWGSYELIIVPNVVLLIVAVVLSVRFCRLHRFFMAGICVALAIYAAAMLIMCSVQASPSS